MLKSFNQPVGDWRDMEKAVEQGKVRSLGISNFDAADTLFTTVNEWARIKPVALQIELHPYAQRKHWQEKVREKEKRFFNMSLEDKQRILPNMQIPD